MRRWNSATVMASTRALERQEDEILLPVGALAIRLDRAEHERDERLAGLRRLAREETVQRVVAELAALRVLHAEQRLRAEQRAVAGFEDELAVLDGAVEDRPLVEAERDAIAVVRLGA